MSKGSLGGRREGVRSLDGGERVSTGVEKVYQEKGEREERERKEGERAEGGRGESKVDV